MKRARWLLLLALSVRVSAQSSPQELEGMGDISMSQGQHELAKAYYKQALQANPQDAGLWMKLERAMEAYHQEAFGQNGPAPMRAFAPGPEAAARSPGPAPAAGGNDRIQPPAVRGPEEIIRLTRPVRPGNELLIAGPGGKEPILIRGPTYEIDDVRFAIDDEDVLHVTGRIENISDRDISQPRVFVDLYDPGNNLWATGFSPVQPGPRTLFPGKAREFEVKFPGASRNIVTGFRARLVGGG